MPLDDFKRPWVITESTVGCQPPQKVHINGEKDVVIVKCGGEYYPPGKYFDRDLEKGKEQRIEKEDENKVIVYEIFFIEKNPENGNARIRANFGGGQIGGSWTAEDNSGKDDDG